MQCEKLYSVIAVFIFSATQSQTKRKTDAKAKITGTVIDSSSNLPLEYATITLFRQGETKAIQWRYY